MHRLGFVAVEGLGHQGRAWNVTLFARQSVLLVDSQGDELPALERTLRREFDVEVACDTRTAAAQICSREFAVIVVIQRAFGLSLVEVLGRLRPVRAETRWLWVAAYPDVQTLADAIACSPAVLSGERFQTARLVSLVRHAAREFGILRGSPA
jgi:DNA-binding NtrC family response regulator